VNELNWVLLAICGVNAKGDGIEFFYFGILFGLSFIFLLEWFLISRGGNNCLFFGLSTALKAVELIFC